MSKKEFIYNNITPQSKRSIGQLTVQEWNNIINILIKQANSNTGALDELYDWIFKDLQGNYELEGPSSLKEIIVTEMNYNKCVTIEDHDYIIPDDDS